MFCKLFKHFILLIIKLQSKEHNKTHLHILRAINVSITAHEYMYVKLTVALTM